MKKIKKITNINSIGSEPAEIELIDVEIGSRKILEFYDNFKRGRIRTAKEDKRFAPFRFQSSFLKSQKTNVWVIGANRSGKSEICFIKTALTMLGLNRLIPAPNVGWIICLDWSKVRDSAIPMLLELIPEADILGWNKSEKTLRLTNGSYCIFKSADSGRSKFQSSGIDWLQIEEEIKPEIYKEAKMRGKAEKRLYIWGSALPSFEGYDSFLYKQIFGKKDTSKDFDIFTPTIYENLALTDEQIKEWEDEFHGLERQIRILGKFFNLAGEGLFSSTKLEEIRKRYCKQPEFVGRFEYVNSQVVFIEDILGLWKIWEKPRTGMVYSLGVDVATGESEDFTCIQSLNAYTRTQVATFHGKVDEDTAASEVIKGAKYYNEAYVIIEITGYGRAVQNIVMKDYYNLYHREVYDKWGQTIQDNLGWETKGGRNEGGTKPLLLADGKKYVRDMNCIRDVDTIFEFQNYIRHKDGSTGARSSCWDDRVMAYLLALRQIIEGKCDIYEEEIQGEPPKETIDKDTMVGWLHQ